MAFNRFMTRTPMQFSFYKEPLDVLSNALQIRQQTFDKNAALADQLLSTSINAMDQDRAAANTITRGYQSTIDNLAEKYQGDYSKMSRELLGLARQVRKDFTTGGEAFAYEYNKNLYDKWVDFSQKATLSPRGPSVNQVNLGANYINKQYTGAGFNKNTGTFNTIQTPQLVEYQEMSDLVDNFAKSVVPNKVASGEWEVSNGKVWYKNKVGVQEVTSDRIQAAVAQGLSGHQGWQAYSKQMEQFGAPISPETYAAQINRAVNTYAYRWKESDQDIQVNPFALEDYKNSAKEAGVQPMTGYYTDQRTINGPSEEQVRMGAINLPESFDRSEFNTLSFKPAGPAWHGGVSLHKGTASSFSEFMANPNIKAKYGSFGQELYKSMQNDPTFQKASERSKAEMYDKAYTTARAEFTRKQDYVYSLNDKTRENLTSQFVRSGFPAHARFSLIDTKGEQTLSNLSYKEFQHQAPRSFNLSNMQESGYVQGMTNPGSGMQFGLEIANPEASTSEQSRYRVVMHGFDAKAEELGKNLQKLYVPYYGGNQESPVVLTPSTYPYATQTVVKPVFENGEYKGMKENVLFYKMKLNENGMPIINADNKIETEGSPFNSGLSLQQLTDNELRVSGLDYQSNKLKDSKF